MKVADIEGKPPKVLLWGDVGTWKTSLMLTLGAPLQVIDLDDGLLTGVKLQDKWTKERQAVDVVQFLEPAPHKTATVFGRVKQKIIEIANECTLKRYPFGALGIDSLSALADASLQQIMSNSGKLGQQPEIQHWGLAFSQIKDVLAIIRTLPIPVVLIGHEQVKTFGSGLTKEEKLELAVSGKNLASQICRYYDEIWYSRVKPAGAGKYTQHLQTIDDGTIPCRSRACIPNMIRCDEIGMWELLRLAGYQRPTSSNVSNVSKVPLTT